MGYSKSGSSLDSVDRTFPRRMEDLMETTTWLPTQRTYTHDGSGTVVLYDFNWTVRTTVAGTISRPVKQGPSRSEECYNLQVKGRQPQKAILGRGRACEVKLVEGNAFQIKE
jgi:hypothetical protein